MYMVCEYSLWVLERVYKYVTIVFEDHHNNLLLSTYSKVFLEKLVV